MDIPEHGEDVSGAGRVFASVQTSAKLTQRLKQVQIITAHEVLRETYDGHHQRGLREIKAHLIHRSEGY